MASEMTEPKAASKPQNWEQTGHIGGDKENTDTSKEVVLGKTKHQAVIRLLEQWLAETSGYDEKTWPVVKRDLEENRLSMRKFFDE